MTKLQHFLKQFISTANQTKPRARNQSSLLFLQFEPTLSFRTQLSSVTSEKSAAVAQKELA
jgi:hypothetical protein